MSIRGCFFCVDYYTAYGFSFGVLPELFTGYLCRFFSFSLSLSSGLLLSVSRYAGLAVLSVTLSAILLLVFSLCPGTFVARVFADSGVSNSLVTTFVHSTVDFTPLSYSSSGVSEGVSTGIVSLFSVVFGLRAFRRFCRFVSND